MNNAFFITNQKIANFIAISFYTFVLCGILFFNRTFFASLIPYQILLSAGLIVYTQEEKNPYFFLFLLVCVVTGFIAEYTGVNYHFAFGNYEYLPAMGPQWKNVPIVIGFYWFTMMYCCGISIQMLLNFLWNKLKEDDQPYRSNVGFIAVMLDSALLATFFNWMMAPVAVELGWWQWANHHTPAWHYISWFGISFLLMIVFRLFSFNKQNNFAVNLLLIQFLYFLILRTVL